MSKVPSDCLAAERAGLKGTFTNDGAATPVNYESQKDVEKHLHASLPPVVSSVVAWVVRLAVLAVVLYFALEVVWNQ